MIDKEEAAIAAAVAEAVDQTPLHAKVNSVGLRIDMGWADTTDALQYCMCWQLTRVLGPSLREKLPPATRSCG
jgi:hypothetical protein